MDGLTPGPGRMRGYLCHGPFCGHASQLRWFGGHGRCARPVEGGLEIRVLDDANTRSLIMSRPGHESSVGSTR